MADDFIAHTEHERRFLVTAIDPDIVRERHDFLRQGYLDSSPEKELRVRIINDVESLLSTKVGIGISRPEVPHPTDLGTANFLFDNCRDTLTKIRYYRDGWEVDYYQGPLEGLVIAEFEMADPSVAVTLPPWIPRAVEVTHSITNRHLARMASCLRGQKIDRPVREYLTRRVRHAVLTSGPCGGKTTIMDLFRERYGAWMQCVPEVATLIMGNVGIVPPPRGEIMQQNSFQRMLYNIQLELEDVSDLQAYREGKTLLLMDRGTPDGIPHVGDIQKFCALNGTTLEREYARYDAVGFLDSPPEEVYNLMKSNNPNRRETYAEAVAQSEYLFRIWNRHPKFAQLVSASDDFAGKVETASAWVQTLRDTPRL